MMTAAIIIGAGVMVELYAILRAPLGYQDENGFHAVATGADEEERGLWATQADGRPQFGGYPVPR